jgi:hypothetical protein
VARLGTRVLMGELFSLQEAALRVALTEELGCIDIFSDVDDLSRLLSELAQAGILEGPRDLEILIYPSAVEETDVALVTVFSTANPNAHVAANSEHFVNLATRELWEGEDALARTVEILTSVLDMANDAVAAVRVLETHAVCASVASSARCPSCGDEDSLRVEYRYDLRGLRAGGEFVLADAGELTDVFCLSCEEEPLAVGRLRSLGPCAARVGSARVPLSEVGRVDAWPSARCPNCLREHGPLEACFLGVIAGVLVEREVRQVSPELLARVHVDEMWDRYGGPATDWLEDHLSWLEADDEV